MKEIIIRSKTWGVQKCLVDDEDYVYLSKLKWSIAKFKNTLYVIRNTPWVNGRHTTVKMHRIILKVTDRNIQVDHRDRNGLNNQKSNIRICTQSQNMANRNKSVTCNNNHLGVTWHKRIGKWQARITKENKEYRLGYFTNELDAVQAYSKKAKELFGEFAAY